MAYRTLHITALANIIIILSRAAASFLYGNIYEWLSPVVGVNFIGVARGGPSPQKGVKKPFHNRFNCNIIHKTYEVLLL